MAGLVTAGRTRGVGVVEGARLGRALAAVALEAVAVADESGRAVTLGEPGPVDDEDAVLRRGG